MPECLNVAAWRASTTQELIAYHEQLTASKKKRKKRKGQYLVVRSQLKPVDVYAYLRARFGVPNGFQNFLRHNDSDNWIHWDFNLKANNEDVYICGTSRDIHFMLSENLNDDEWKSLILALRRDFSRIGRVKSEMTKSFEKFVVFQNKFVTIANLCAEMHETIFETSALCLRLPRVTTRRSMTGYTNALNRLSARANKLYGDCLKLRLLTPIMAEAFINMIIVTFCRDDIRNDEKRYKAFIRSKITTRLEMLSVNCDWFTSAVDPKTEAYAGFVRVMNKRNFAIHGNVDPEREQIETVYFEGKRPLFAESGDHILKTFEHLEKVNAPTEVLADYEAVHAFLIELTGLLAPRAKAFFEQVIHSPYPGYEVRKKRVTRILPDHTLVGIMQGMRYDDDLKVVW